MAPTFALATLLPYVAILAGFAWGGPWAALAVVTMTALVAALDGLVARHLPALAADAEFPAGPRLSLAIAVAQIGLLPVAVLALSGGWLSGVEKAAMLYAAGLWLGQVGNSNAHELIHRSEAHARRLGQTFFVAVGYGHHVSAHPKVHHTWVATPRDPATARLGEGFYAYLVRSWTGSFQAGRAAERALLARRGNARGWPGDPYPIYVGGALAALAAAALIGGLAGVLWFAALAAFTQLQLLLSDYVQHYGLEREQTAPGRFAPVDGRHSWNAPHWYSGAMMLNAPRHSDHHAHPARPFQTLDLPPKDAAPRLPRSLPTMSTLALFPTLWRRVMDRRAAKWRGAGQPPPPVAA